MNGDTRPQGLTDMHGPQDMRCVRVLLGCGQTRLHPRHPPRQSPHLPPLSAAAVTRPPVPGLGQDPCLPWSVEGHVLPEGPPSGVQLGEELSGPPAMSHPPPGPEDTSTAPQKATFWTPGWEARTGPREAGPLMTLRIPGNEPSSPASWASRRGVGEAGGTRTTTVQPGEGG